MRYSCPAGMRPVCGFISAQGSAIGYRGFLRAGKPVGAICDGVLLAARSSLHPGKSVLHGKKTTALTKQMELIAWRLTRLLSRRLSIEPIRQQSRTRFDRCWRGPKTSSEGRCRYAVIRRRGLAWDSQYATEITYRRGGRETPIASPPNSPRCRKLRASPAPTPLPCSA